MALSTSICQTAVLADCSQITITDQTGTYDPIDNIGGYGTPNPARADVALYLLGYKYRKDEDPENITGVINNTDPGNVTSWDIAIAEDGYYFYDLLTFNQWNSGASYVIGDLVFDQQVFYKALINNSNSAPTSINTNWEIVTDFEAEVDNTSLADYYRYHMAVTCRVETCYARVVHDSEAICGGCPDCQGQVLKLYMKLDVLLQSAFIYIAQTNWAAADSIILTMIGYCKNINCKVC